MEQEAKRKQQSQAKAIRCHPGAKCSSTFCMLGFINIGGPVAQITMMYNHMVERRHWLSEDRFVKIMAFCHMLPGTGSAATGHLCWLLETETSWRNTRRPHLHSARRRRDDCSQLALCYLRQPAASKQRLYVLKPAVLGIIGAGILKLGRASIRNFFLAALLIGAFVGMRFAGINFLFILLSAGLLNLLIVQGWPSDLA